MLKINTILYLLLFVFLGLIACQSDHQNKARQTSTSLPVTSVNKAASSRQVDSLLVVSTLKHLSSDAFEGRKVGTAGGLKARNYIIEQFKTLGLTAFDENYLQEFDGVIGREKRKFKGSNVIAYIKGTAFPDSYLAMSAHYDHIGIKKGRVYNGADDNASGIGALLGAAHYFMQHPPQHSLLFLAFDAEEYGMQGSNWFCKQPSVPFQKIKFLLNMDMLSRSDVREIYASGTAHFSFLAPVVQQVSKAHEHLKVSLGHDRKKKSNNAPEDWTYASDHACFFIKKIPYLYFGVEDHADYHKATDEFEKINLDFYLDVVEFVVAVMQELDTSTVLK